MKKYFLLSQILLLSIYSKSQQPPSKLSVDASVGLSLPVGKFGDKSAFQFANNSAKVPGWSNIGSALQLNINYQIKEFYGISFLIGGQKNEQDKDALENQARQYLLWVHPTLPVASPDLARIELQYELYSFC
jgi:hypothetical protein